jgi:hypothetical protein
MLGADPDQRGIVGIRMSATVPDAVRDGYPKRLISPGLSSKKRGPGELRLI